MLVKYTPEERARMEEIKDSYMPAIAAATDPNEKSKLTMQYIDELNRYMDECARRVFDATLRGNTDAILEDAKFQLFTMIETYRDTALQVVAPKSPELLKRLGFTSTDEEQAYLNANIAAQLIAEDLKLHIEALEQDDPDGLQRLYAYIVEAVENSKYTDDTKVKLPKAGTVLDVLRLRRGPLADIKLYGLMNDQTAAQVLQDGDLFQLQADGQWTMRWEINQASSTEKQQVPVYIALTYEGTESQLTKKLTGYDKAVYEAVSTRFFYWKQQHPKEAFFITPQEIWRTMNGKKSGDGSAKPGKTQIKRLRASMDKMRFTRFRMDISEEMKAHNIQWNDERVVNGTIDTYLLNSSWGSFTTEKGNTVEGYKISIDNAPILYTYNAIKNRLLYVPYELLDTSANTSDSENVTEFKSYLLQQIQLMKYAAGKTTEKKPSKHFHRNNIILLDTLYKSTGVKTPEERAAAASFPSDQARQTYVRKARKADRGKIEALLDAWTAKDWIRGYEPLNAKNQPVTAGKQAKGYRINI